MSVELVFRGPLEEPAAVTSAKLFVSAWGVAEEHDLPIKGNIVRLDLDATRPDFADAIADTRGVMYVKAEGYTSILSEPFEWPAPGAPAVIDFRNGRRVKVGRRANATLDIALRHPVPRRVRLVDLEGRSIPGANVAVAAHWPTPNHCGFMHGRDVLASGSTTDEGSLEVPDLDGPYMFSLIEDDLLFADADNFYAAGSDRQGLIVRLTEPDTALRVRRYVKERLSLEVIREGRPVPGAVLWADMQLGVCGAGSGPLATADSQGRIRLKEFRPEMWESYWVCAGGEQVWVLPDDGKLPTKIDVGVTPSGELNRNPAACGGPPPRS